MAAESPLQIARDAKQATDLLEKDVRQLERELEVAELSKLRDRIITLETTVAELKRQKEEAEKRQWQFVYIFVGTLATLLSTVVVQLVLHVLKK